MDLPKVCFMDPLVTTLLSLQRMHRKALHYVDQTILFLHNLYRKNASGLLEYQTSGISQSSAVVSSPSVPLW